MNLFYHISSTITVVSTFILGTFVYLKSPRNTTNRTWFLLSISVASWSAGFGIMTSGIFNKNATLFIERLSHVGAIFIAVFYLYFMISLINKTEQYKGFIRLSYFFAFTLSIFVFSKWFIIDVVPKQIFKYYPKPGTIYIFFILHFFSFVLIAAYLGFKNYAFLSPVAKNQIKYVFAASIIGFLGGATTFPLVYDINFPPIGGPLVFLYTAVISFAIIRYRLMAIRVAVTRFGIFAIVYTLVLGIPFWVGYKFRLWQHSTWIMLVLATLGPAFYTRLEKRSREVLYKIEFKRYETLRRLSKTLLLIKDLDKLVELIVYRLVKTLKVSYAAVYLYDKERDAFLLKSFRPLNGIVVASDYHLNKNNPLIKLLTIWKKELLRDELKNMPLYRSRNSNSPIYGMSVDDVHNQMTKLSATLIIPHFLEDDLLGFLVLGDKELGAVYTEEDISILSSLSNAAALAIENSMFLVDLKITQAELFNAKRIAELGYMASAMGHEINNRLQAIYAASQDMIDNPTISACINQNADIKAAFEKDVHHINENIEDATKIIDELKTYARPQDKDKQNFEMVDLKLIIDKAINIVRLQSIKSFDVMELDISLPMSLPKIWGNFIQLQQVFVNMLNNAHDAIVEKRGDVFRNHDSNNSEYKGKISIQVQHVKNMLNIHIIDNGIGMTDEIMKRLFIPLYTSKASADRKAQRDITGGTGIGLYTIQTIIRGHSGTISVFETHRAKGTDFLMRLPISREQ